MSAGKECWYSFGPFRLNATERVLFRNGEPVNLPPKALETLLVLVQKAGHIVEKDELMATMWPDVFVEESNLSQYVFLLRKALGTSPNGGPYIETIPRRGYRFIATVTGGEDAHQEAMSSLQRRVRRTRWKWAGGASLMAVILASLGWNDWHRNRPAPGPSEWVRLTDFADSVTSPAISPDGRMLAFLRGPGTFTTTGQIYVKMLPDGEAVQVTHDSQLKMGPVFSPDGSRIAYTVPWDTWEVPVLGGEPRLWLTNASGLTWIRDRQILFSEIKTGLHMAIVTSSANRTGARDVYVPAEETMMAHRSYPSPDGKWALVVEMEVPPISWLPCRLVSLDASLPDRQVGPPGSRCTSAAWLSDGRWMYFTADVGTGYHVWRQRFPDGTPEQITFGPTEEEGIVMAPDGRSFITAVGLRQNTLWIHDADGERQISSEGDSSLPCGDCFSPDGKKLYYQKRPTAGILEKTRHEPPETRELWVTDLKTGRSERVLPGFNIHNYDLSEDGLTLVFRTQSESKSTIWITSLERGAVPRQLASSESFRVGVQLVGEHIFFAETEGDLATIYRMNVNSGKKGKIVSDVIGARGLSPDGQWIVVVVPTPDQEGSVASVAYPIQGGSPVPICDSICNVRWDSEGKYFYISFDGAGGVQGEKTFVIPLMRGQTLPDLPPMGFRSEEEVQRLPGVFTLEPGAIFPGPSPLLYAFTRTVVHRNLYRIPIP